MHEVLQCKDFILSVCTCLTSGRTSGWAPWWCHRSPAQSSLRWHYELCLADNLKRPTQVNMKNQLWGKDIVCWYLRKHKMLLIFVLNKYRSSLHCSVHTLNNINSCTLPHWHSSLITPLYVTFPEPFNTLMPGNGLVSINSAAVSLRRPTLRHVDLSLEPDFHHVSGLSDDHCHHRCGAACQQPGADSSICDTSMKKHRCFPALEKCSSETW